jgi:rhodanese-related sulfurtransferase
MIRRSLLLLACLLPAASVLAAEPYQEATLDEVQGWVTAKAAIVYDVNGDDLWEKNHVPGARHLVGKEWTKTLPTDKGARLVFYCSNTR